VKRAFLGGLCLLVLSSSVQAQTGRRPISFTEALRHHCPTKRLDYLNPGILVDGVEAFRDALPGGTRRLIERLARADLDKCEAGATCVNQAYIRAAAQMRLSSRLAQAVCDLPYTCRAPFDCQSES
jgi:hypothetical protein